MKEVKINLENKEAISRALVDITSGIKAQKILKTIMDEYDVDRVEGNRIINMARNIIKNNVHMRLPIIVNEHLQRYEYLFDIFRNKINRTDLINECLRYKEELLGLHREVVNVMVNNTIGATEVDYFDIERLTTSQRKRFDFLINKVKR